MKRLFILFGIFNILTAAVFADEGLLFHASFENGINADYAQGTPEGKLAEGGPNLAEGISGKAILLEKNRLSWQSSGNILPPQGTVTLWVKPHGWDPEKPNRDNYFFNACLPGTPKGDKIQFFKLPTPMLYFYIGREGAVQTITLTTRDWAKDEWRFFALTWDKDTARLYINGKKAGEVSVKEPPVDIGEMIYASISEATVLDELRIYDRPLIADKINSLYLADYLKSPAEEKKSEGAAGIPVKLKIVIPKIKGTADLSPQNPEGWDDSADITGFLQIPQLTYAPRQTRAGISYDDKNLYIRVHAVLDGKPKTEALKDDGHVWADESFEIFLSPTGDKPLYQLIFNSADVRADLKDGDIKWNGEWKTLSDVTETEWWGLAVIPFRTLGLSAPSAGDKWLFNLGRNCHNPQYFTNVTFNLAYADITNFGEMEFGGLDSSIKVHQKLDRNKIMSGGGFTAPERGEYKIQWSLLKVEETILNKRSIKGFSAIKGDIVAGETKNLQVQKGGTASFAFSYPAEKEGEYYSAISIASPSELLFRQVTPFAVKDPFSITLLPASKDGILKLIWELAVDIGRSFLLDVKWTDTDGKTVLAKNARVTGDSKGEMTFPLKAFPGEKYTVTVRASSNLGSYETSHEFLSYMNAEWHGFSSSLADRHIVPPPWKPVEREGAILRTVCSEYDFSEGPLPAKIRADGRDVLAGPVSLVLETSAGGVLFQPESRKWERAFPDRVSFAQEMKGGGITVQVKTAVEFDGMMRFDVTFKPVLRQGVTVKQLSLEIPIKEEHALLKYPYRGHLQKWSVLDLEGGVGDYWSDYFMPHIWVGDDERGLAWFAETDQNFHLEDPSKTVQLIKKKESVTLKIIFIDQPITIKEPLCYTFGLMATPSRPVEKDWFTYRFASCVSTKAKPMVSTGYTTGPRYHVKPGVPYPAMNPEDFKKSLSSSADVKNLVYVTSNGAGDNTPEYRYYKQEWQNPGVQDTWSYASRGFYHDGTCPSSSSWRDFFLWSTAKAIEEYGIDGLYYDYGTVMRCNNRLYCGYSRDGKEYPSYPIFYDREMRKQIYILFYEKGKEPFFVLHNYSQMVAPIASFNHMLLDGESYQQRTGRVGQLVTLDYTKLLTMERLRAMFGIQFGTIPIFLPTLPHSTKPDDEIAKYTRTMVAMTLPLGIQCWGFYCNIPELNKVYAVQDRFEIKGSKFYPCWKGTGIITASADRDVYIGYWQKEGKTLCVVSNLGEKPFDGVINVKSGELFGRETEFAVYEGYGMKELARSTGSFNLNVAEKDYILIELRVSR